MEEVVQLLNDTKNQKLVKEILKKRQDKDKQRVTVSIADVLPCYFFDFMIGTSTGGLIAVMLGRLRMGVDDCIKGYWQLSNVIFTVKPWHKWLFSSTKLVNAINTVITKHCHCHSGTQQCIGHEEEFRQYDYAENRKDGEDGEPVDPPRINGTCKVHHARYPEGEALLELNPKSLHKAKAKIWEVCRATTAAPFYFRKIRIEKHKHMDGGVGNNNPADLAWNEAIQMYSPDDPKHGKASLLLSLGTGQSKVESRFGKSILSLMFWAKNGITETEGTHLSVTTTTNAARAAYYRLNVPTGLSDIKLGHCKKKARKPFLPSWTKSPPGPDPNGTPEWYIGLRENATEKGAGSFRPDQYHYSTFEKLFQLTRKYYEKERYNNELTVEKVIQDCAQRLVNCARLRLEANPERWTRFVSHPDPSHPLSLKAESALP
ncbi:lipid acyl hydrolase [Grosmannia clavigera kw1407]|uniref:Lipid acyl hydrolase n=1 Tax=Grosmannia clavigera (strain kw1407 / UAMH 11150) TaxID=655863 RepID=F0X7I3_GROCL|nr:lipid acyl hydrolase [Grosmannia clavigera kw1407]EFX06438.1 lipid acyl hydrolase [Grosmannia clavigera kw1407]